MPDGPNTTLKIEYNKKLEILKNIRHEIKRRRFLLDESVDRFGFDDMSLLSKVENTDQVKGYPMVASKVQSKILKGVKVGLKVVPIETKFEKHEHPTTLEFIALKELTDNILLKNISPHFVYYLGSQKVSNKSRALKFLNLKRLEVEDQIRTHSNMLISEYIQGGSLDNWVYDIYENDAKISSTEWKALVFQLVYTIAILQHHYRMMHNDFHYGNILIDTSLEQVPGQYFVYTINNTTFYLPNTGFIPRTWDYEFSMCYSNKIPDFYPNKFIMGACEHDRKTHITKEPIQKDDDSTIDSDDQNVPYNYNEVYDVHYFLTSLLDLYISQDLFDWIIQLYPDELIPREVISGSTSSSYDSTESSSNQSLKNKLNNIGTNSEDDDSKSSSNSEGDSESDSEDNESDNKSSSRSEYNRYLSEGRIKNGIETEFDNLPTPNIIMKDSFFDSFKNKPTDFDESKAIYFKAGF